MKGQGDALMGIGIGHGDNRAVDAATNAINNPLLEDARIEGAKGILVNVTGGNDFSLTEYEEIVNIITANADDDALIIPGTALDESFGEGADLGTDQEVQVTVVATGFNAAPQAAVAEPADEEEGDEIIKYKDWLKMREGIIKVPPHEYLLGRNSEETDLGIPTVLRGDRMVPGEQAQ
jgi:cell division protein FtsZ